MISLKDRYPFRLGTTSFIHPADYLTNAQLLAEYVDEVELLFFESHTTSLPSREEIDQLAKLRSGKSVSYNIHLPIDLDITHTDSNQREQAALRYADIILLSAPLSPTTYTLHLECNPDRFSAGSIGEWQKNAESGIQTMLAACQCPAQSISIETLGFPFEWLAPIVDRMGLSICIDVGHVVLFGYDLASAFQLFSKHVSIMHLHGVSHGKDHRSLQWIDETTRSCVTNYLSTFTGTVSIEVFSYDKLDKSMNEFVGWMPPSTHEQILSDTAKKSP